MEYDDQQAPSKLWLEIADEEKLYLAIPQGYQDHWNDVRGDCEHNGDEDDVGFINAMINEIQSRYSIERTDTFLSAYESVDFWVNFNNCDSIPESYVFPDGPYEDSSTVSREIYDNGVQNTEVILYRIDGGGHVEPSIEE